MRSRSAGQLRDRGYHQDTEFLVGGHPTAAFSALEEREKVGVRENNLGPPKSVISTEPFPPHLLPQAGETLVNGGRCSSSIGGPRPSGETPTTIPDRRS